jgi:hypothetical protein
VRALLRRFRIADRLPVETARASFSPMILYSLCGRCKKRVMSGHGSRSTRRWKRVLVLAVLTVVVILFLAFFQRGPEPESIEMQFAGFSNRPGMTLPYALFVITNVSDRTLDISVYREIKTSEWPINATDTPRHRVEDVTLLSHAASTSAVPMPDYGTGWRVRFSYSDTWTKWGTNRFQWASSLHRRRMHRLARFVSPRMAVRDVVTLEMESADWQAGPGKSAVEAASKTTNRFLSNGAGQGQKNP